MTSNGSTGWPNNTSNSPSLKGQPNINNWNQQQLQLQQQLQQQHQLFYQQSQFRPPTSLANSIIPTNPINASTIIPTNPNSLFLNQPQSTVMYQQNAYASILDKQQQQQSFLMYQNQLAQLAASSHPAQNPLSTTNFNTVLQNQSSFSWANPSLVSDPAAASLMFQSIEAQANAAVPPNFNQQNRPSFTNNLPINMVNLSNKQQIKYPAQLMNPTQCVTYSDMSAQNFLDNAQNASVPNTSAIPPSVAVPSPSLQIPPKLDSPTVSITGSIISTSSSKRPSIAIATKTPSKSHKKGGKGGSKAGAGTHATDEEYMMQNDLWYREWIPVLKARNLTYKVYNTGGMQLDWKMLWETVHANGGWEKITNGRLWRSISDQLGYPSNNTNIPSYLRRQYATYLFPLEVHRGMRSPTSTPVIPTKSRTSQSQMNLALKKQQSHASLSSSSTGFSQPRNMLPPHPPLSHASSSDLSISMHPATPGIGTIHPTSFLPNAQLSTPSKPFVSEPVAMQSQKVSPSRPLLPLVPVGFKLLGMKTKNPPSASDAETDSSESESSQRRNSLTDPDTQGELKPPNPAKKSDLYEFKKYFPKMSLIDMSNRVAGMNIKQLQQYMAGPLRGGYESSLAGQWRHNARTEPYRVMNEIGVLDIRALTCMLSSGLKPEITSALNILLVVSTITEIDLQLDKCPALVRSLADLALDHFLAALRFTEMPDLRDLSEDSRPDHTCAEYLVPVDDSVNEVERLNLEYELEIALQSLLILRNLSFEYSKAIASLPRVYKALLDMVSQALPRINSVTISCIPCWSNHSSQNNTKKPKSKVRLIGRSFFMIDTLVNLVHHIMVLFANITLEIDLSKIPKLKSLRGNPMDISIEEFVANLLDLSLFWLLWSRLYVPELNNVLATSSEADQFGTCESENADLLALSVIAALLPQIDPMQAMDIIPCNPVASTLLCTCVGHTVSHPPSLDMALIALRGLAAIPPIFVPFIQCHVTPIVTVILALVKNLPSVDSGQQVLTTLDVIIPALTRADAQIQKQSPCTQFTPVRIHGSSPLNSPHKMTDPFSSNHPDLLSPDPPSIQSPTIPNNAVLPFSLIDAACLALDQFPTILGSNFTRLQVPWDQIADRIYQVLVNECVPEPVRDGASMLFALVQDYRPSF